MDKVEEKTCQNCSATFTINAEDFSFYEKINVPAPTFCPECRFQRRMAWRNERSFFRNTCGLCNKKVLSVYPEDSGMVVYCRPCWWSDKWSALDYGIDFDPKQPFLNQLFSLLYKVPVPDLFGLYTTLENSDYTNMVGYLKNCYFLTMGDWNENCAYSSNIYGSKDSYDALILDKSELCYETVNCRQCYKTLYSVDCEDCSNVSFSRNCFGCSDCIGCINLRNKQYCIFNEQYTKEEYLELSQKYQPSSRSRVREILSECEKFFRKFPNKYIHERLTENVTGDYIYNAKNVRDSFMVQDMQDARFCALVLSGGTNDCYDHTHYGEKAERLYETLQVGNQAQNIKFSWFVITGVENIQYSFWCIGGNDLFGCMGLKKQKNCILNKQYSKDEYEKLTEVIKQQMDALPYKDSKGRAYKYGEFFPIEMSPFAYNISGANEIFPMSEKEARNEGYKWKSVSSSDHTVSIAAENILDAAAAVSKDVSKEVLGCAHKGNCIDSCSVAFRVTHDEIKFYNRLGLPLPDLCPNCRHYSRFRKKNPFSLNKKQCMCDYEVYKNVATHIHHETGRCPNEFETSFPNNSSAIVYCEQCYQQEVI